MQVDITNRSNQQIKACCLIHTLCLCGSWPVAALAGVPVDETRLAAVQVGVSPEALEIGGLVSYVLVQSVRAALTEVSNGVPGGCWTWGGGGLWAKACVIREIKITLYTRLKYRKRLRPI